MRVVHYLNQFFAGIGGDEKADIGPSVREGAVGPGRLLQTILKDKGEVVATLVCGDNFISGMPGFDESHLGQALKALTDALEQFKADMVIAGPAFLEGRYGIGCGEVCKAAQRAGVPAVTAMHPDNVAVPLYRKEVYIIPTGDSAGEMTAVMTKLRDFALELCSSDSLASPEEEGYLPRADS
jgi:glycine reductase